MIEQGVGNLLEQDVEALVNTVNTVGVMGKGIALQFRQAFPANYKDYRRACEEGKLTTGKMLVHTTGLLINPRFIINLPTKRDWRNKSDIDFISTGLDDLVTVVRREQIASIAIPALGCGNGRLNWDEVRPLIEAAFVPLQGVRVVIFAPSAA